MIQTEKNYVYGTAARKLDQVRKEERTYSEESTYKRDKATKNQSKVKANNAIRLKTMGVVILIFVSCLIIMYRYALITEINYNLGKLEQRYNEIKNENTRIKIAIEEETDLTRIKKIAEEKLGMQKPDRYQIVYINVPKRDFTKVTKANDEKMMLNDYLLAALKKIAGFIK